MIFEQSKSGDLPGGHYTFTSSDNTGDRDHRTKYQTLSMKQLAPSSPLFEWRHSSDSSSFFSISILDHCQMWPGTRIFFWWNRKLNFEAIQKVAKSAGCRAPHCVICYPETPIVLTLKVNKKKTEKGITPKNGPESRLIRFSFFALWRTKCSVTTANYRHRSRSPDNQGEFLFVWAKIPFSKLFR